MNTSEYSQLKGIHTINSIMNTLGVDRNKAIYYIHRLRKKGYIKTRRAREGRRIYDISLKNKIRGINYFDIINKYALIGVEAEPFFIYGKTPTLEETLIFAIKTKSIRIIQASLYLFRKIDNWSLLYHSAKKENLLREVGALYDLARKIIRTKRMTKRCRNNALPKNTDSFKYIVNGLSSKDFKGIENTWKIYLPFNKADLEAQ